MEEPDETQQNMVSNLPLLFANGYPTSLDKITEQALENFIPFMVQCSLGHINVQGGKNDTSEPEWWPEDVPFSIPIAKPKKFEGNWVDKMKEIVVICYQFHKSIFLLRFCYDLAAYEPTRLRFINNYNSTTSLYDRRCNKLLVTFRNENMSYDQPQKSRKNLLLQKSRSQTTENNNSQQQMVEPALFEIYLCDNCDAELYSLEAITQHEKTCIQDDDVIICESPPPETITEPNVTNEPDKINDESHRASFLLNFGLQSRNIPHPSKLDRKFNDDTKKKTSSTAMMMMMPSSKTPATATTTLNTSTKEDSDSLNGRLTRKSKDSPVEKLKRLPRRNRAVYALSRCPTVPLSSPAGQLMIKTSKTLMTEDYLYERLDRMERFCHAPLLSSGVIRPKFLSRKFNLPHATVSFKKPLEQILHMYTFPRRQFFNRYRVESFLFLNSLLLKQCRPISVRLKKLNELTIMKKEKTDWDRSTTSSSKVNNIRLHRENSESRNWKISPNSSEIVVDTIDLCSSDDDDDNHVKSNSPKDSNVVDSNCNDVATAVESDINATATAAATEILSTSSSNSQAQFLGSEITLTPIYKNLEKEFEDIRKKSKFEGNFLLSQSITSQPKPLQPSVFLFSNYTTESIHFHLNNTNNCGGGASTGVSTTTVAGTGGQQQQVQQQKLLTITNNTNSNNLQNQENLERNIHNKNNNTNGDDWLPNLNRTDRNSSSNKLMQLLSCSESDVVLNKISSPNRTISIDLTL